MSFRSRFRSVFCSLDPWHRASGLCRRWLLVAGAGLLASSGASAQSLSVLYQFQGGTLDGSAPQDSLLQVGGLLYGTTLTGGSNSLGTLFDYDIADGTETVLHSYGGTSDGASPYGSVLESGPLLYATTSAGGTLSGGAIVQYNPSTTAAGVTYSFAGPAGATPKGSVIQSGTMLLGTTSKGGPTNAGSAFEFTPSTNAEQATGGFGGTTFFPSNPSSSLLQVGSNFYGTVPFGGMSKGGQAGYGGIFEVSTSPSLQVSLSYVFASNTAGDGAQPNGSLIQVGTLLYGMTVAGGQSSEPITGPNFGTIYAFDPTTNTESVVYSFGGAPGDGAKPFGALLDAGSILYGMTSAGGSFNDGTIFEYNLDSNTEAVLHSFDGTDGSDPTGSLLMIGDTVYGMTDGGGIDGDGTIFSLEVPEPASCAIAACAGMLVLGRRRGRVG